MALIYRLEFKLLNGAEYTYITERYDRVDDDYVIYESPDSAFPRSVIPVTSIAVLSVALVVEGEYRGHHPTTLKRSGPR